MPGTEELYYHSSSHIKVSEQGMHIGEGNKVPFDTYFNTFFCKTWNRYTTVRKVNITINIEGTGCISLIGDNQKTICKKTFSKAETIQFQIDITDYEYCYLTIQADTNTIVKQAVIEAIEPNASSSATVSDACEDAATSSPVRIALVTCTYNRQEDIKRNIEVIKAHNKETKTIEHIYIVDNAQNLNPNDFECENITLIPNRNTGGAGGFTRGMQEAMKRNDFTHILLMDDDVCIEFEAFCRTKALLTYIKPEFKENFVGGAMLRRDMPWVLHASGEVWQNGFIVSPYHNSDIRTFKEVQKVSVPLQAKQPHAAWWYCCIPKTQIENKGYPIPFFLHFDDIEYSLRSEKTPIFMNGIAVWHEQFEDKKSAIMDYYDTRNALITNAIYIKQHSLIQELYILLIRFYSVVIRYRYKDFDLIVKAVEDFLKGPAWLYETDSELLHKTLADYTFTMSPVNQIPKFKEYSKKGRLYSAFRYLLPATGSDTIRIGAPVTDFAGKKELLLVDPKNAKGFTVRKSWLKTFQCVWKLIKCYAKMLFHYRTIKNQWLQTMQTQVKDSGYEMDKNTF